MSSCKLRAVGQARDDGEWFKVNIQAIKYELEEILIISQPVGRKRKIKLDQWFSIRGDFIPQETSGEI